MSRMEQPTKAVYRWDAPFAGGMYRLDPQTELARIRAFFIAPRASRRGIGDALYEKCAGEARRAGLKGLELMATHPGVPFYEQLGFRTVEIVSVKLPDGVDLPGHRMRISL